MRLVADRVNPFYMGIWKWLRNRPWFWPAAFWAGVNWLFRLGDHPLVRIAEILLASLALFGVAIVVRLHLDSFVVLLFVVLFLLALCAKGARLKWLRDLEQRPHQERPKPTPPMQLPPVPHEVRHVEEGRTIIRPLTDDEARDIDG